ncbi:translocation/assembly module TamB domain-containing protein [Thermomonas sp. HDW16]|uniref:translocation/assembly module TamB domain-containing protein n=1 Tax=Thermomonas sp. HDW16 TaxID=2714945 RepID=UPI001409B69B|nr:translocation/assembly module TamB domain-containing protein [Thermomonas sp. HDW16]QIL19504.1 translocation/assembly module TamB [Thermomonas sp. HDW16]
MTLRARYQRYRRYGLEPLANDASDEQRDERLAEIGRLRRSRQRKIARRGALTTLATAAIVALLLYWLLMTIGGRDVLLRQIVARLPAGTELTWQSAEGPAAGPMVLHGVHFSMPRQRDPDCVPTSTASCAMGRIMFDAKTVTLDPAIRPLLGRTLRLDALDIEGATLNLPRSDKPFELPRWPDVLPQIEPPLALQADAIHIDGLKVMQEGEALIDIRRARGGLDAAHGALHVERLVVDSDRGRFAAHGDYIPREDFRSDLLVTAVLPAPAGQTAPRIGLLARGNLSNMDVAIGGRAPAPLHATLTLRGNQDVPRWLLRADSEALDIGLLTGSGEATTPLSFNLSADGTGGSANLRGNVKQGGFIANLQPSKLSLDDKVLRLQPLVVDVFDGRVTANGTADLHDPQASSLKFAINARGLRWNSDDGKTMVGGDADFGIAGKPEHWAAVGKATLHRDKETAHVVFDGIGDRAGVRIRKLQASMPQGRLDATGNVAWAPTLQWKANATLAGFDPGYFLPDWPGAVNGRIESDGGLRENGTLLAHVDARDLGGTLRGRALGGRGTLDVDGEHYSGDVALSLGGSRIDARGRIAGNIEVDANLSPLQLNDLLPDGRGSVRGILKLRGTRNAPDVDADLRGEGLAFGDYRAERFIAKGRLPWRNGNGALAIDAQGLQLGLPLSELRANLRGAVERLQFDADARSDLGALALRGNADKQGARWQGALAALQFDPSKGAAWTLQQPTRWSWDGGSGALSRACLQSNAGGTLCADADWPRRGLNLQGEQLPLALLVPYLPEREDGRPWLLNGDVNLDARIAPAGNAWRGTASITSASGGLRNSARARRDLIGYRDLKLDATFDPQRIGATLGAVFNDDGRIDARIATGWDDYAPLSGEVKVNTDELTWMELFSPDIVEPTGKLDADLRLAGTRAAPIIGGEGHLQDFATELPSLGIALREGDLRMQAQADGNARIVGRVRSGDGVLDVDGTLGWRNQDTPLVLNLRGTNVLIAETRQLRAVANPDVVVRYRAGQPLQVTGTVTVPEADINLERLDEGVSASSDVVVLDPVDPKRSTPNTLDLDLALVMGKDVAIKGFGLTGTLGGSLRVRAAPGREMRGTGALEVGGRYTAYGQRLQITRGRLLWSNTLVGDPVLDIRAEREVGDVTAGIRVEGRASAPRATVYSDPAKSDSEALAYLTLGRPLSSLTGDEARQLGAAKSALNAGTGLLAAELGSRIGLDDAGVTESRALGSDVLSVGKYLSPKLYVGYGVSLLGTGQVLMLKYLLRKGFDIQVESSTVENRASVNWRKEK